MDKRISWFEAFGKAMNVVFTKNDFLNYREMVKNELKLYKKYLKKGAKVLDIGCGLGCEAVPLSGFGYKVVGIDNDRKVVESARKNANKFGKKIKIVYGDIFKIDKIFGKDSFDACISGGVLEHFPERQVRQIVRKQLYVAPLVIASIPLPSKKNMRSEYKDYRKRIFKDGIYRNFWSVNYMLNNIFKGFNIIDYKIQKAHKSIGNFKAFVIIISRK